MKRREIVIKKIKLKKRNLFRRNDKVNIKKLNYNYFFLLDYL